MTHVHFVSRSFTGKAADAQPSQPDAVALEHRPESRREGLLVTAVILAALALITALVAVGYGSRAIDEAKSSTGASPGAAAGAAAPSKVAVRLSEFAIDPKQITVAVGGTLDVTNGGTMPHNLAVKGTSLATKMLAANGAESLVLTGLTAGTYTVYCQVPGHEQAGMTATLVVGGSTAAAATGATTGTAAAQPAKTPTINEISRHPTDMPDSPDYALYKDGTFSDKVTRTGAVNHEVHLQIKEGVATIVPGTTMDVWTFEGAIPAPMIRTRVGDTIDFFLTNPSDSQMPHNTDFHAVMGPGGGSVMLDTVPGATSELKVKTTRAGVFIYHCAFPDIPTHIAHGMYGLVVVEPPGGLPKVDHEYYLMQSEFYTTAGGTKSASELQNAGHLAFSGENANAEDPTFVVYNGRPDSINGARALGVYQGDKITVGQTVRLFVGNIGPNLASSFHIIGEMFDNVYVEGSFGLVNHDVQTTLVPSGGAVGVDLTIEVPGDFVILDHSIFRLHKGAGGTLHAEGPANPDLFQPITHSEGARGTAGG